MPVVLKRSLLFALVAFVVVLSVDAILSLGYQSPPSDQVRSSFIVSHGLFHGAVFALSTIGVLAGFAFVRQQPPSVRVTSVLAIAYGLCTVIAGPGLFVLAGPTSVACWLLFGSLAFGLGSRLFRGPWRRPAL